MVNRICRIQKNTEDYVKHKERKLFRNSVTIDNKRYIKSVLRIWKRDDWDEFIDELIAPFAPSNVGMIQLCRYFNDHQTEHELSLASNVIVKLANDYLSCKVGGDNLLDEIILNYLNIKDISNAFAEEIKDIASA